MPSWLRAELCLRAAAGRAGESMPAWPCSVPLRPRAWMLVSYFIREQNIEAILPFYLSEMKIIRL